MKKVAKRTLVREWVDENGLTCQEWKREWVVAEPKSAPKKAAPKPEKAKVVEAPKPEKVEKAKEKEE